MRAWFQRTFPETSQWLSEHRRHLPTVALVAGFIWDWLTLGRPDRLFDNAVLLFYVVLSGLSIIVLSLQRQRGRASPLAIRTILQFAFGNLTSALFILYSISGTFTGNWVFFLMLIGLLVGNEYFGDRYGQLRFNVTVYSLLVLAYFVLITPVVFARMGAEMFLVAAVASLGFIILYGVVLDILAPRVVHVSARQVGISVLAIHIGFTGLYFSELIPPVPLALRDMGIYHQVQREGGAYRLTHAPHAWYEFFESGDDVIYKTGTRDRAYCFSSVFAPADLSTPIVHHWQYYDLENEQWNTHARIPFSITGGRDEGFRGFSYISALQTGRWRCRVETERGALVGRQTFTVQAASSTPGLVTEVK